ncbi:MAG TPA: hypothetical protein VMM55_10225 [Thermohalobaculum sp.]|nr:hypothetical protein [Thermohalobaculum sp.]
MASASENKSQQGAKSDTQQGKAKGDDTDIELIKNQLERLREDFSSLGEMVGMTARHRYQSARDDLTRGAETTKAQAVDQLTQTLNEAEATVRRNPLTALAIVLGIGYLFGLFSRK